MSIFYSLIARNNDTILCEADESSGNYPQITLKVLRGNKMTPGYKIFSSQDFLCLAGSDFSKVKSMSYLNELKETFMTKFGPSERESAIAYSFNSKLESHMKDRMAFYSGASESDTKIRDVVNQMKDVENIVNRNLEDLNERGEKLQILVQTTKHLSHESKTMHQRANRLHRQKRCENIRKKIILCFLFWLVAYIVAGIFCGFDLGCLKSDNNNN